MNLGSKDFEIDSPYSLTTDQMRFFRENGFVKLKNVLSEEILGYYGEAITQKVLALNPLKDVPMEQRTTYKKAFIQITNLWEKDEAVREFVFGQRLARIAAELMGTRGVRLYHDQALYKEPSGGLTPWHADQYYWPLATEKCCTAWIPLQATPLEMGPVAFAAKSHHFESGRNLEISDESEQRIQATLDEQKFENVEQPFEIGEVSFHYGWTFHRAGPNTTTNPRKVMTIIYMDEEMRLSAPGNEHQKIDWEVFCPGINVGELIDSPLNPVLYSADNTNDQLKR